MGLRKKKCGIWPLYRVAVCCFMYIHRWRNNWVNNVAVLIIACYLWMDISTDDWLLAIFQNTERLCVDTH